MNSIRTFATSESGAVTVDWVLLTAGIVGLALAVLALLSPGLENLVEDMNTQLHGEIISTTFASN
ncbi:pilus assembly protein [Roseicyclus sp.]|uniref:pilus assembly protein n=1 Tax=Roseicyclus sp. TaxID=1914329 RepID=UPI003FA0D7DA